MKLKYITAVAVGIAAGAVTLLHFAMTHGEVLEAAIVTAGMAIMGVLVVLAATEEEEKKDDKGLEVANALSRPKQSGRNANKKNKAIIGQKARKSQ